MGKIFISFVGMGHRGTGYSPVSYSFNGKKSRATGFVQVAEIELLGPGTFYKVILLFTAGSARRHQQLIISELNNLGLKNILHYDSISEEMSADAQWSWFESILNLVDRNDSLTIDLTHGFRAVPIVLSAAIGFLQRARNIKIEHVLYGNYEKGGVIVDMKDFYVINDWAEAVSRRDEEKEMVEKLRPFYNKMKTTGIETIIRSITKEMLEYRNAFDHAWVSVSKDKRDSMLLRITENAEKYLENLRQSVDKLVENKFLQ